MPTIQEERATADAALKTIEDAIASDSTPDVSGADVAKRLAKLLWSSEPDKALAEAAGGLNQGGIEAQVRRMLTDDRTKSFVAQFFLPWLQGRFLDSSGDDFHRKVVQVAKSEGAFFATCFNFDTELLKARSGHRAVKPCDLDAEMRKAGSLTSGRGLQAEPRVSELEPHTLLITFARLLGSEQLAVVPCRFVDVSHRQHDVIEPDGDQRCWLRNDSPAGHDSVEQAMGRIDEL